MHRETSRPVLRTGGTTPMAKVSATEREEHLAKLREWFPKGSTVYTILRHVSASGMTRHISPVAILTEDKARDGRLKHYTRHPSYSVAAVCGYTLKRTWPSDSLDEVAPDTMQAGRDFWYTRNGHGCGFWDGDWPEPYATQLTKAAKAFGEVDAYLGDDGKVYVS